MTTRSQRSRYSPKFLISSVTMSFGDRIAIFNRNSVVRDFTVEKMNFTILKD